MALSLKAKIVEQNDQESIYLYDTTGSYSVTNTGGYGAPNIALGDINDTFLYVKKPGETSWVTIIVGSPLPSSDPSQFFEVTAQDLGYGANSKLPDGYYEFWYQIQGNDGVSDFEYNYKTTQLLYGQVKCCIQKKLSDLRVNESVDALYNSKIRDAYWKFEAMKSADCCGNRDLAESILKYLQTKCNCCH